ncbi:YjbH domain-containing protein [Pseudomonadales bacterium]|nr:YjbH domain-containing protein [Pseudomonadales bacterium]MDB3979042.1 YjbH domain-containing protein [Pseudomonadales bacterium]
MMPPYTQLLAVIITVLATCPVISKAGDFGTTGLITLPSARMQADGSLTATIARNEVADIYNVTFQATPFIETSFRYSIFNPRDRVVSIDENRDRSYEVKLRLLQESARVPELAIGIRDILGTGVWSGEYLVASKLIGPLDISGGLGWGRFAGRESFSNPLKFLSDRFEERPSGSVGGVVGGEIRGKSFFRGGVGVFGGVRYSVPNLSLDLIAEYSSDDYSREVALKSITDSSPISVGFEWRVSEGVSVGASYQQGEFVGLTLKSTIDFKSKPARRYERFYSAADQAGQDQAPDHLDLDLWYDRLIFDAERSGLRVHSAYLRAGDDQASFIVSNDRYALWADALNQFYRLAEIHLPPELKAITIQTLEDNMLGGAVGYQRARNLPPVAQASRSSTPNNGYKGESIGIAPGSRPVRPAFRTDFGYPKLALGADLALRIQLMDPNEPLKHQLYVKGTGRLALSEALNIWSAVTVDVSNDFNTKRPSDSVLPRVRSEINQYLTEGESGIDSLFAEYRQTVWRSTHARVYVGLLEEMFGGAGFEVLYEPFASRWAFGGNLNWVQQRNYDKRFSFQDYDVMTGHVSAFYASPWYNLDFGLHIGQFLAKDQGYTFEARRSFDNGFSIGAFFTRTNVSALDFGEGSFDKGLFLSVPYSLLLPRNTRGRYSTIVRSIERDGGRRLEGAVGNLWWDRRALRFDALQNNLDRIAP